MSANYEEYLHDHVKNVGLAYNKLCELMPDIRDKVGDPFFINQHDLSKWNDEEYGAYDRYFYGGNRSASVMKEFNYAWLTHIHNNPHHWQYWVLINDDDGENRPLEMPYNYIVEMICDWWSFSWKEGKPERILDWYEDHRPLMELHPRTRKIVEDILKRIRKEYIKEEEEKER